MSNSMFQIFKNSESLIEFIEHLPKVDGFADVELVDSESSKKTMKLDSHSVLSRLKDLAEPMFDYRRGLAKYEKGLGNNKSVNRYSTIRAEAELKGQMDLIVKKKKSILGKLSSFAKALVDTIKETDTAMMQSSRVDGAKLYVVDFKEYSRNVIMSFESSLRKQMDRIKDHYESLAKELSAANLEGMSEEDAELVEQDLREAAQMYENVRKFNVNCYNYCVLQAAYAELMFNSVANQRRR